MNNKVTKSAVLVFLFALCYSSQVFSISISFEPSSASVNVGDAIDVDVVVSGLSAAGEIVSAYDLFVSYDASVLTASTISYGSFLDTAIQLSDTSIYGLLEFSEISLLTDAELALLQSDSFTLATLSFSAIAIGSSLLTFEPNPVLGIIDVVGRNYQSLEVSAGTGLVSVVKLPVTVPEPGSMLLMLLGLLVILTITPRTISFRF